MKYKHDQYILALLMLLAALLRFYEWEKIPPGLYRDEAFHGLDALSVLAGDRPLFFFTNNGREPLYIYFVAAAISVLGQTPLAIRLPAMVIGTISIIPIWLLIHAWFGRYPAHFTAFLWAITVWTIHLSRVGFRAILMPPLFSLSLWVLTVAWRKESKLTLLAAGCIYGVAFYSYLAIRLTPVFLALFSCYYLWQTPRCSWKKSIGNSLWFIAGATLLIIPLAWTLLTAAGPTRTSQVSILHPDINGGNLLTTIGIHFVNTLKMFFIEGDTIARHNPVGRPIFDLFMIIPFLSGLLHCLYHWRTPVCAAILLWIATMSTGTLLAEDAPHFLRAVGILPAVLALPAIGLSQLISWSTLPVGLHQRYRLPFGLFLIVGSFGMTINDYFITYPQKVETTYLFESAATMLAEQVNATPSHAPLFVDPRLSDGWPSIRYLITHPRYESSLPDTPLLPSSTIFVWPWSDINLSAEMVAPPINMTIETGALARGDLETEALPLYIRYLLGATADYPINPLSFEDELILHEAKWHANDNIIDVELAWTQPVSRRSLTAFVHIVDHTGALLTQSDKPPGGDHWNDQWWQPELVVTEQRQLILSEPFDVTKHILLIGVYETETVTRLQINDNNDEEQAADIWQLAP